MEPDILDNHTLLLSESLSSPPLPHPVHQDAWGLDRTPRLPAASAPQQGFRRFCSGGS